MSDFKKGDLVRIAKTRLDYLDGQTAIVVKAGPPAGGPAMIKLRLVDPVGVLVHFDRNTAYAFDYQLELLARGQNDIQ